MNRGYQDPERDEAEGPYGEAPHHRGDEQHSGRPGYNRGTAPDPAQAVPRGERSRGTRRGYSRAWDWSDQVWSGRGRFDEGGIGQGRYGYGPQRYAPSGYHGAVYGQDEYGWIERDEPQYVGSLYRGERRGEEPFREREWRRSTERPGLIARLYARGPKGYSRSDERIKEDISESLWRAEDIDSSEVTVAVEDGVVVFTGTVPERWMRHEIEDIADNCMGVKDIRNEGRVLRRMTEQADIEMPGGA